MREVRWLWLTVAMFFAGAVFAADESAAPGVVATNTAWRVAMYDFCRARLQHSAWGLAHAERNFILAQRLAKEDELKIDEDVLFAAAFLHDIAAFEEFGKAQVDHTERGAEVAAQFLSGMAFPKEKIPAVQEAIRGHMFYSKAGERPESVVLRDADTLDFLGYVGVARIVSLTTRHSWANDLRGAVVTIDKFSKDLPAKLVTRAAKKIGEERRKEMKAFLDGLDVESNGGKSL